MKSIFFDRLKSYLTVLALGVLAGLLVVLFCELPDNELWAFYDWSASTYGFWMFSTSLLVLCSEKRKSAAINTGIYIFVMFFITTLYKSFRMYWDGNTPYNSLIEVSIYSIYGWLLYSVLPAALCAALALVLWTGRKNNSFGKILRIAPAVFILLETVLLFYNVFAIHTKLFSAVTNLICLMLYLMFYRAFVKTENAW